MALVSSERPRTDMPRIGAPSRIGWIPARMIYWIAAGITGVPLAAQVVAAISPTLTATSVWDYWQPFAAVPLWFAFCMLGAFFRPGGLGAASWLGVLIDYRLRPRKGQWK